MHASRTQTHHTVLRNAFATPVFATVVTGLLTQPALGQTLRFALLTAAAVAFGGSVSAVVLYAFPRLDLLNVLVSVVFFCLIVLYPGAAVSLACYLPDLH